MPTDMPSDKGSLLAATRRTTTFHVAAHVLLQRHDQEKPKKRDSDTNSWKFLALQRDSMDRHHKVVLEMKAVLMSHATDSYIMHDDTYFILIIIIFFKFSLNHVLN